VQRRDGPHRAEHQAHRGGRRARPLTRSRHIDRRPRRHRPHGPGAVRARPSAGPAAPTAPNIGRSASSRAGLLLAMLARIGPTSAQRTMAVTMRSLEIAVPSAELAQEELRDVFLAQDGLSRLGSRLVSTSFDPSGIERRYSALDEWDPAPTDEEPLFFDRETGQFLNPTTGTRNQVYAREATELYIRSATEALAAAEGLGAADVTHVITVSCTGFFAPGPDYRIVRALDLDPSVERYHLGFMGCYAAFPALRQAQTICQADPEAVVLVVSVELCTLHVRTSNDPDTIVGSSLFADGAAAAVVTGRDLPASTPLLQLDHFETVLTPVGEDAMAWSIGDNGFEMVLGTYVPHIIDEHIVGALAPLLDRDPSLAETAYH